MYMDDRWGWHDNHVFTCIRWFPYLRKGQVVTLYPPSCHLCRSMHTACVQTCQIDLPYMAHATCIHDRCTSMTDEDDIMTMYLVVITDFPTWEKVRLPPVIYVHRCMLSSCKHARYISHIWCMEHAYMYIDDRWGWHDDDVPMVAYKQYKHPFWHLSGIVNNPLSW